MSDLQLHWVEDENSESGYYDENTLVNKPTTRYYYDGQMMIEDDYYANAGSTSSTWSVTRYGLGARGIDYLSKVNQSGPQGESFPIYDGHGNMVATLSRSGSNNFALANFRSYDVCGSVRQQNSVDSDGGPSQRYCANLGHVQDDESDLIYMRARYFEPGVGRFVSEDPARAGKNWFTYCANCPTVFVEVDGRNPVQGFLAGLLLGFLGPLLLNLLDGETPNVGRVLRDSILGAAAGFGYEWLRGWIAKYIPGLKPWQQFVASVVGGIGTMVATYYGIRAGQILFELFANDLGEYLESGGRVQNIPMEIP